MPNGTALSIIPLTWDTQYFLNLTGVTNQYGFDELEDGWHFKYLGADYDAVQAAIAAYPVSYLSVTRPQALEALSNQRNLMINGFQYNGTPVPMDSESRANLTGAALGLTRNTDVVAIHWKIASGVYITLPRDVVLDMADQAFRYVESCFSYEKTLADQINAAADIDALAAISLTTGWPPYPGQTQ